MYQLRVNAVEKGKEHQYTLAWTACATSESVDGAGWLQAAPRSPVHVSLFFLAVASDMGRLQQRDRRRRVVEAALPKVNSMARPRGFSASSTEAPRPRGEQACYGCRRQLVRFRSRCIVQAPVARCNSVSTCGFATVLLSGEKTG